jgi:D-amino-acid dehydrogenase
MTATETPPVADTGAGTVAVIGAGIVGVCAALELRRRGHAVTLIDREGPAAACSFGNAGLFAESSFEPSVNPAALKKVPGWLLRSDGPISVRWRYLPGLTPWLLRFLRAAFKDDHDERGRAMHALTRDATARYERLAADAGVPELVRRSSILAGYRTIKALDEDDAAYDIRRRAGYRIDRLGADDLRALEPALAGPGLVGGIATHDLGFTPNPGRLTRALCDLFRKEGGTLTTATVTGFDVAPDGAVRAVRTDAGDVGCSGVVLAAGAYSARLLAPLGVRIPLETERGYHVLIRNPGVVLTRPTYSGEGKMVVTPMEDGLRVAGTVEFASLDAAPDPARVKNLLAHAHALLPGLDSSDHDIWMGCRPTLPDDLPIIDRCPGHANMVLAFGHQHLGLTGAPATANLVADLAGGRTPNIAMTAYRSDRFS